MTTFDAFDHDVRSWLDDESAVEIPIHLRNRVLTGWADGRPRPALIAVIGSRWVAPAPRWGRMQLGLVVVAVLTALALVGTALLVAVRRPDPVPGHGGRLLFDRDGDIFVAHLDGTPATMLVDGAPSTDPAAPWFTLVPEVWAPDGEHFVFFEYRPTGVITHVADATGKTVSTWTNPPISNRPAGATPAPVVVRPPVRNIKAPTNVQTWWSPDSTMLATFPWTATELPIYGIDGRLVTSVPLPRGYEMHAENGLSGWTPEGDAVFASISSRATGLQPETWRLPLDGSPGRRVLDGDPFVDPGWDLSPDGHSIAFRGHVRLDGSDRYAASPFDGVDTIYVGDVDGNNQRPVGATHTNGVGEPQWSPDGTRILYTLFRGYRYDIYVLDVATGVESPVAKVLGDGWAPYGWSPDGDAIFIGAFEVEPAIGGPEPSLLGNGRSLENRDALVSLWQVDADGTSLELLADGLNYFGVTR